MYICKKKEMNVPFTYGKLVDGWQFINRDKDIENLSQNINSGVSTVLISPRRWGKSSLMMKVAEQMSDSDQEIRFCFIDLFSVRGEEEFYHKFATEVLKATSTKWEDWIKNGKQFIKKLIPRFQIGIDPLNDFSVSFDWQELKKGGDEILDLPEKISRDKNIKVVVCIDEFQNIAYFDQSLEMQKKMRAVWQKHKVATYCLYGSKRHMLSELFENKSMPFYKFGETVFLDKIAVDHWEKYIVEQFASTAKQIEPELANKIATTMANHPYFVQLFAAKVWKLTKTKCIAKTIETALEELKMQYALMYQRETDSLSNKQVNFLRAFVKGVKQFSSQETLSLYRLGSQGNIKRIKEALENKEVLDLWGNKIEFIDPLFGIWFVEDYLKLK